MNKRQRKKKRNLSYKRRRRNTANMAREVLEIKRPRKVNDLAISDDARRFERMLGL